MTYPVGPAPDGAYVVGSVYGQDITEESAKTLMGRRRQGEVAASAG
ncbi:hypothetical protein GS481_02255 [Rhodococcus hoagii]|nr:hypothetical protein [Prescottella equi]